MSDIVIITTYNRPEYLRLCLEALSRAHGSETKEVWICLDRGKAIYREICEVVSDFRPTLNVMVKVREPHSYFGNSYNTLEAYREAYNTNARYVYLVEDDVLVQSDFFEWHEAIQETGDYLCSVAYHCFRNTETFIGCVDASAYFTTARDYASIGVCWRREQLAVVVSHACEAYYDSPREYLHTSFPRNRFQNCFTEQDGLIMRILGESPLTIAWPYVPRCFHIGFRGYNRPLGEHYTTEQLREIIHDAVKVKQADRDFHDIEVVPTQATAAWSPKDLHCLQRFE